MIDFVCYCLVTEEGISPPHLPPDHGISVATLVLDTIPTLAEKCPLLSCTTFVGRYHQTDGGATTCDLRRPPPNVWTPHAGESSTGFEHTKRNTGFQALYVPIGGIALS